MGLLTAGAVKNSHFTNPTWRTTAILKTVKSLYLCNRLTDFDEIWHGDAHCSLIADRPLKFRVKKNKMAAANVFENCGLCYGFTDLYEVWCGNAKWVS